MLKDINLVRKGLLFVELVRQVTLWLLTLIFFSPGLEFSTHERHDVCNTTVLYFSSNLYYTKLGLIT